MATLFIGLKQLEKPICPLPEQFKMNHDFTVQLTPEQSI